MPVQRLVARARLTRHVRLPQPPRIAPLAPSPSPSHSPSSSAAAAVTWLPWRPRVSLPDVACSTPSCQPPPTS
ncbi:hypothetical protein EV714DRAFT_278406 [Schizophyllum commune]